MVGVAKDLFDKKPPIDGLRHAPEGQSNGWYFWTGGEIPDDPTFFEPIYVEHLYSKFPELIKCLALEPGFRIQFDLLRRSSHEHLKGRQLSTRHSPYIAPTTSGE